MRKLFSLFVVITMVCGLIFSFSLSVSADDSVDVPSVPSAQAEGIPEGYRLLKDTDVGKTFGVDLDGHIYIDNSVVPSSDILDVVIGVLVVYGSSASDYRAFLSSSTSEGTSLLFRQGNAVEAIYTSPSFELTFVDAFNLGYVSFDGLTISSVFSNYDTGETVSYINNWLYVKPLNEEPQPPAVEKFTISKGYYQWPEEMPNSALEYLFNQQEGDYTGIFTENPFYTLEARYRFTDTTYMVSEWRFLSADSIKRPSDEFPFYTMSYTPFGGIAPSVEVYGGVGDIRWDSNALVKIFFPEDASYSTPPAFGKVIYFAEDTEVEKTDFDNLFVFLQPTDSFQGANPEPFDNFLGWIFQNITEALDGVLLYEDTTLWDIVVALIGILFFIWVLKVIAGG